MAFVRRKIVHGHTYYQVVQNYRKDGKHKQAVLCHLGVHSSLDEAIRHHRQMLHPLLVAAAWWEEEADSTKDYLLDFYGIDIDTDAPLARDAQSVIHDEAIRRADEVHALWEGWDQEDRRLYRRYLHEYGPVEGAYQYHTAKQKGDLFRKKANAHQSKLNKLLEVQQKYF